jgi:hypothetical protein
MVSEFYWRSGKQELDSAKTVSGKTKNGQESGLEPVNTVLASQNTSQKPGNSDILKIRVYLICSFRQPEFLGHP